MAAKPSKFSSIFEAPQEPEATEVMAPVLEADTAPDAVEVAPEPAQPEENQAAQPTARTTTGKKSDPRYKQVIAYVRKDLYRNVTGALYDEARGREDAKRKEFSELVDELLEKWWQDHTRHNA